MHRTILSSISVLDALMPVTSLLQTFPDIPRTKTVPVENCWVENIILSRPTPNRNISSNKTAEVAAANRSQSVAIPLTACCQ